MESAVVPKISQLLIEANIAGVTLQGVVDRRVLTTHPPKTLHVHWVRKYPDRD